MKKHYVFVDLENVSPRNLSLLKEEHFYVKIFVGKSQGKIAFEVATAMQAFGERGEYIKILASGKNALDFHIAYFLGITVEKEPNAHFHVIAKDTGYDPLITYMRSKKVNVKRHVNIEDLSNSKTKRDNPEIETAARYERVLSSLEIRGRSRPRKPETLRSTIRALFSPPLDPEAANAIIDRLTKEGIVKVSKNTVTYSFAT